MEKKNKSVIHKMKVREVELIIFFVILITAIVIGITYYIFASFNKNTNYNTYTVGNLKVTYNKNDNGIEDTINLVNETPIKDNKISDIKPIKLIIENPSNKKINYTIYVEKDNNLIETDNCSDKQYNTKYLKYKINNKQPHTFKKFKSNYLVYKGSIDSNKKEEYNIRVWVSKNLYNKKNKLNKHFHAKVVVHTKNEKKNIP